MIETDKAKATKRKNVFRAGPFRIAVDTKLYAGAEGQLARRFKGRLRHLAVETTPISDPDELPSRRTPPKAPSRGMPSRGMPPRGMSNSRGSSETDFSDDEEG